jgi:hypothetical protein
MRTWLVLQKQMRDVQFPGCLGSSARGDSRSRASDPPGTKPAGPLESPNITSNRDLTEAGAKMERYLDSMSTIWSTIQGQPDEDILERAS